MLCDKRVLLRTGARSEVKDLDLEDLLVVLELAPKVVFTREWVAEVGEREV